MSSSLWDTCRVYTMLPPCSSHHRLHLTILTAIPCTFKSQVVSPFWQICLCLPILCRMKFQGLPMITKVARGMYPSYSAAPPSLWPKSTMLFLERVTCFPTLLPGYTVPFARNTVPQEEHAACLRVSFSSVFTYFQVLP